MERAIASRNRPADTVEIRQLRAFLMLAELSLALFPPLART